MADNVLEIEARLKDLVSKELDKLSAKIESFGDRAKKANEEAARGASRFGKTVADVKGGIVQFAKQFGPAAIAIGTMTAAIRLAKMAISSIIGITKEFESTMSRLKAITQPTVQGFKDLSIQARELGKNTVFSASQVGNAFVEMGKLGLSTNEIIKASQGVLDLAASSQSSMSQAAEVSISTLKQFQLDASETNRVVDVMAKSFTISALDVNRFQESMKFAGPIASQTGEDLESTTAALAALAEQGVVGSQAGTGLRFMMSQLAQEGTKVGEVLGITANDTRSLTDKLNELRQMNLTTGQVMEIFGERAGLAATILLNSADSVSEFEAELRKASGTAAVMSEDMLDNLNGDMTRLSSAASELAIIFGEALTPALRWAVKEITELIDGWNSFFNIIKNANSEVRSTVDIDIEVAEKTGDITKLQELRNKKLKEMIVLQKKLNSEEGKSLKSIVTGTGAILTYEGVNENLAKKLKLVTEETIKLGGAISQIESSGGIVKAIEDKGGEKLSPEMLAKRIAAMQKALRGDSEESESGAEKRPSASGSASVGSLLESAGIPPDALVTISDMNAAITDLMIEEKINRENQIFDLEDQFNEQRKSKRLVQLEDQLALERQFAEAGLTDYTEYESIRTEIAKINARDRMVTVKEEQRAGLQVAQGTFKAIGDILKASGKQSKEAAIAMKTVAIGEAIISGAQAAINAWNAGMSIVSPVAPAFAAAFMATSIATTGAQIATIASQKFAMGTRSAPGGMALVGEHGPELVTIPRGAAVNTAGETRSILNSTTNNSTVNNNKRNNMNVYITDPTSGEMLRDMLRSGELDNFAIDFKDRMEVA